MNERTTKQVDHLEAISHSVFKALEHVPPSDVLGILVAHMVGLSVELAQLGGADVTRELKLVSSDGGRSVTIGECQQPHDLH